jgi:hypothetical protein
MKLICSIFKVLYVQINHLTSMAAVDSTSKSGIKFLSVIFLKKIKHIEIISRANPCVCNFVSGNICYLLTNIALVHELTLYRYTGVYTRHINSNPHMGNYHI